MVTAIIVAAGTSSRMSGIDKCFAILAGKPLICHTIEVFDFCDDIDEIIVVTRQDMIENMMSITSKYRKIKKIVVGGNTRGSSVRNGLQFCTDSDYICIHDGGRPLVSNHVVVCAIKNAKIHGAITVAVPVKDTIKIVSQQKVISTPQRKSLYNVQTPQVFCAKILKRAYSQVTGEFTDDCQMVEQMGVEVHVSEGDYKNIKITTPEDLEIARSFLENEDRKLRIGHGYDVHRLDKNRKLILCGVDIPYEKGLAGHSDADVAIHSIIDALLGAMALGDIGKLFPDSDSSYKDANSLKLLEKVVLLIESKGFRIGNIDCTIVAQNPKISPYVLKMRENIAYCCKMDTYDVSVKATTEEGLGFTGTGEGICAHAVCLIDKI